MLLVVFYNVRGTWEFHLRVERARFVRGVSRVHLVGRAGATSVDTADELHSHPTVFAMVTRRWRRERPSEMFRLLLTLPQLATPAVWHTGLADHPGLADHQRIKRDRSAEFPALVMVLAVRVAERTRQGASRESLG